MDVRYDHGLHRELEDLAQGAGNTHIELDVVDQHVYLPLLLVARAIAAVQNQERTEERTISAWVGDGIGPSPPV